VVVAAKMPQWQRDSDLAGLRGPDAIAGLEKDEREEWQKFWAEVAMLLRRAQGQ
jgi:hypothetical protein